MADKKQQVKINLYEAGDSGIDRYLGFVQEAYNAQLHWPSVQPLYSRIRRSDPEISIVRLLYTSLARRIQLRIDLPDDANEAEIRAAEYAEQVLEDLDGGPVRLLETIVSNVPFYGWGWFEILHGYRDPDWTPPDPNDSWRSQFDDGLVGLRRLAWRDPSSFKEWQLDPVTGRLLGMVQTRGIGKLDVTLPLENSLHVTFGDADNPEGLSPLEAVWRLERIKYGLEVIQGIGFEHAAGYLDVTVNNTLSTKDEALIKKSAKNIMTAQEGNYAVWPKDITGEIKDIPFAAAGSLLGTIKYYGILKLSIFCSQWVALSSTTGSGSYAAMDDSSSMFLTTYNAMLDGFVSQIDEQVFRRLYEINALAWPGLENRPKLKYTPIDKKIGLEVLGGFIRALDGLILGDDDIKAIREKSGILPTAIPTEDSAGRKEVQRQAVPAAAGLAPAERSKIRSAFKAYLENARTEDPETYSLIMSKLKKGAK